MGTAVESRKTQRKTQEAQLDKGAGRRLVSQRSSQPEMTTKERTDGETTVRVLRNVRR